MFQEEYDVVLWVLVTQVLKLQPLPLIWVRNIVVTMSLQNIAQMSCNPTIWEIAKDRLFVKLMP
jgi:hypothetical protein